MTKHTPNHFAIPSVFFDLVFEDIDQILVTWIHPARMSGEEFEGDISGRTFGTCEEYRVRYSPRTALLRHGTHLL